MGCGCKERRAKLKEAAIKAKKRIKKALGIQQTQNSSQDAFSKDSNQSQELSES